MMTTKIILFISILSQVRADYGLVYGKAKGSSEWQSHVCIVYNPSIYGLPSQESQAIRGMLKDFSSDYGCYDSTAYVNTSVAGDIVAVSRGNCTFVEKTDMAEQHSAIGVIAVTNKYVLPGLNQSSDIGRFNIPIGSMLKSDLNNIKGLGDSVELMMYAPVEDNHKFDFCIVVIFFIAVVCIVVGGYWSGVTAIIREKLKEERKKKKAKKAGNVQSADGSKKDSKDDDEDDEDENLDITIPAVIVFFILVCTFLVLLYFFYDYLVFVIIALFCVAGSIGLFYCILPLWEFIPFHKRFPKFPCCKYQPEIKHLMLYSMCAAVAIVWAIQRHQSYAWVLQDILGLAFCINMLKTIQVPNLKICSILLILLFFYDIFFVFITPYFTKGESIMVKVATGGSGQSAEKLPMLFMVPKLNFSPYYVCQDDPSMLGFGDVIVPGLLVGYAHLIDLKVGSKKIYYLGTVIAYSVGMIITFVALELMQTGQPALLYLVPCTLITIFVIGCIRGEVKLLWTGKMEVQKSYEETAPQQTGSDRGPDTASVDQISVDSNNSTTDNENKSLLRK